MQQVWKLLSSTIRHDYGVLNVLLDQTSYEIVYSKFGIVEYRQIIATLQSLQQALISSSSALELIDRLDPVGVNAHILGGQATLAVFSNFRHGMSCFRLCRHPLTSERSCRPGHPRRH